MSLVTFIYIHTHIYIYIHGNFSETKNFVFNLPSNESRHGEEHFHIKKCLWGKPRFHVKCFMKTLLQKRNFLMAKLI